MADTKWCWGCLQCLWNWTLSLYFSCSIFSPLNTTSFLWQQRFSNSPWLFDCMSYNWKMKWWAVTTFALIRYPSFNVTHTHLLSLIQAKIASSDTEIDSRRVHQQAAAHHAWFETFRTKGRNIWGEKNCWLFFPFFQQTTLFWS